MNYRRVKPVGILACSAEGAALCYRTICLESRDPLGEHAHPEITMHTHCLREYMEYIEPVCDWSKVANLMQNSYDKLCEAGAQIVVCPDNTIHQAYELVRKKKGVAWLHIAQVVGHYAKTNGYGKVGVLGTKFLMEGPVYPEALESFAIECVVPDKDVRGELNRIIFSELVNGEFNDKSRRYYSVQIDELKARGCDAVILGCTEIPLLIQQVHSSLPILDSTRLLARAAIEASMEGS